jgi:hypothetical protein
VIPLFDPTQLQFHGPFPETLEALPALQRFDRGALRKLSPFAEPQAPLTSRFAEQCAVEPPFNPAQFQCHGPSPVTMAAIPAI